VKESILTNREARMLWDRWIDLWNGDLEKAPNIIHPEFAIHRFPPPRISDQLYGREALLAWIVQTRSLFEDLHLTVEVGPIVDGDTVAGRWIAEGTYRGGVPGSTAPVGTSVRFRGNDIWRAEGGVIREYWLSDDLLDLMRQLGVIPGG
jgi:predicted ester cyclase